MNIAVRDVCQLLSFRSAAAKLANKIEDRKSEVKVKRSLDNHPEITRIGYLLVFLACNERSYENKAAPVLEFCEYGRV